MGRSCEESASQSILSSMWSDTLIVKSLASITWRSPPIPSANLVHPDCRIVMLSEFRGDFSLSVLQPSDLKSLPNVWLDAHGRYWDPRQLSGRSETFPMNADLTWGWLVYFGERE